MIIGRINPKLEMKEIPDPGQELCLLIGQFSDFRYVSEKQGDLKQKKSTF